MKSVFPHSAEVTIASSNRALQLGCLTADPSAIRAAIDSGADWVTIMEKPSASGPRYFHNRRLDKTVQYAHDRGRQLVLDLCVSASTLSWADWHKTISWARDMGFDAVVLSKPALALCCATHYPDLPVHFAAPAHVSARIATLLKLQLGVTRILVPQAASLDQLINIAADVNVELQVSATASNWLPTASRLSILHGRNWQKEEHNDGSCGGLPSLPRQEEPCNDTYYVRNQHISDPLNQLPLLADLRVRAIQVEPQIDTPEEVGKIACVWRTAIDRCFQDRATRAARSPSPSERKVRPEVY